MKFNKIIFGLIVFSILVISLITEDVISYSFLESPKYEDSFNSYSFLEFPKYEDSFNLIFDNGLKAIGNDSKGNYSVKVTGFIELTNGKRQDFVLSPNNIPFNKLSTNSYKYNISISNILTNIKYVGLYLTPSKNLDIEINNHDKSLNKTEKISFCGDDSCIEFWLDDIPKNINYIANESEIKIDVTGLSNLLIDPTITFVTAEQIDSLDTVALDTTRFAIVYCDETTDDIHLKYFYANGTNYTNEINVDTDVGTCSSTAVSISLLNSTHLSLGYFDDTDDDVSASVYDFNGNQYSIGDIETSASADYVEGLDVAPYNDTHFVMIWRNNSNYDGTNDIYYGIRSASAVATGTKWLVGAYYGSGAVSMTTINSTLFGFGLTLSNGGGSSFDAVWSTWNNLGNHIGSDVVLDTNIGLVNGQIEDITSLNSTHLVITYFDDASDDVFYTLYTSSLTSVRSVTAVDLSITTASRSVSVTPLNSSWYVISYLNGTDQRWAIYNYNVSTPVATGSSKSGLTVAAHAQVVTSWNQYLNIGFCNKNWVHVYYNSSSTSAFTTYQSDGSSWDGTCPSSSTFPQWSLNSTNSTSAGAQIQHSVYWTDDTALSGYIFSFDNGTGTFVNDSFVGMIGTTNWSNVTKGVNTTSGATIQWKVYANDSSNNWNVTSTFSYVTASNCWTYDSSLNQYYVPSGCTCYKPSSATEVKFDLSDGLWLCG